MDEVDVSAMQDLACGGEAIELTEATDRQADADDQRPFPEGFLTRSAPPAGGHHRLLDAAAVESRGEPRGMNLHPADDVKVDGLPDPGGTSNTEQRRKTPIVDLALGGHASPACLCRCR